MLFEVVFFHKGIDLLITWRAESKAGGFDEIHFTELPGVVYLDTDKERKAILHLVLLFEDLPYFAVSGPQLA